MVLTVFPTQHGPALPRLSSLPLGFQLRLDSGGPRGDFSGAHAGLGAAAACGLAGAQRVGQQKRHRCSRKISAKAAESQAAVAIAPTDYYGLLGLPAYTSDRKEIKSAHRRVVKLVHPDILGVASGELQRIVNEAYKTLSDDDARRSYDAVLRRSKLAGATLSRWAKDAKQGVFVDETVCAGCHKCAAVANNTFVINEVTRKPYVDLQWGNSKTDIDIAVLGCPEQAISYVHRDYIPILEFAMAKSRTLKGRSGPFELLADSHCRVVELVHPKEIGGRNPAAELREEYDELWGEDLRELRVKITRKFKSCSDADKRAANQIISKKARPALVKADVADGEDGVFVDETACVRCYKCVEVASSTFAVHTSPDRNEKAYVAVQDGDAAEIVETAIRSCPSKAIKFVPREDLPLLEFAMREAAQLQQNSADLLGPYELFERYSVDDLIRMEMELRELSKHQLADPESTKELADTSSAISTAALAIPADVRGRLWLGIGGDTIAVEKLMAGSANGREQEAPRANRAGLKGELFKLFDADGNGFLYSSELKGVAENLGFEGSDSEWTQEYVMICTEVGCDPTQGLDFRGFSQMVDDEESYIEDGDMADLLGRGI